MEGSILIGVQDPYKRMSYVAGKVKIADEKKPAKLLPLPNPSIWTELGQSVVNLGHGLKKAGNDFLDNGISCTPPSNNKTITNDAGVTVPVVPIEEQLKSDAGVVVTDPTFGATFATDAGSDSLPADARPAADALPAADTAPVKTDTAPVAEPDSAPVIPVNPEIDGGVALDGGVTVAPDTAPAVTPDALIDPPVEIPNNIPIKITGDRIQSGNIEPISVVLIGQGLKKISNLNLHVAANPQLIDPKLPCVPGVIPVATRADGSYKFNPNDDGNRLPVSYAGYNLKDNTGKVTAAPIDGGAGALTGGTNQEVPANCSGAVQPTDIKITVPREFYTTSDPAKKGTDGVLDATLNLSMPIDASNYGSYGGKFDYRIEVRAKANE